MWPHSWACWPQLFVSEIIYLAWHLLGTELFYLKCSEESSALRPCRCPLVPSSPSPCSGWMETVRAARGTSPDPTTSSIYSSEERSPRTSHGKRAGWRNHTNTAKSDWVAAISHLFLPCPLTLPYPPVSSGASLAPLGAQQEERTQSLGWALALALL